jgi:hypothetical protein
MQTILWIGGRGVMQHLKKQKKTIKLFLFP